MALRVCRAKKRKAPPFTPNAIGSRCQRLASFKIPSGLAVAFRVMEESQLGRRYEKKKEIFFFFHPPFPYILLRRGFSCFVSILGTKKKKSFPIYGQYTHRKSGEVRAKCKSTCRHNLRESICTRRPADTSIRREIEMHNPTSYSHMCTDNASCLLYYWWDCKIENRNTTLQYKGERPLNWKAFRPDFMSNVFTLAL